MAIIQHLIIDEFGAFLGKHSERLIVTKDNQKIAQAPLLHLESVLISGLGVSLSADAVQECAERGIPIFFLHPNGRPYASLYSSGLVGTIATRRAQLEAYRTPLGLALVVAFGLGKLRNQANLLKYFAKSRKESDPGVYEELRLCALEIMDQEIAMENLLERSRTSRQTVIDLRQELMGIEGRAAERYWKAVAHIIPESYGFPGRTGRNAADAVNAGLNYGYGVLYGLIERALLLAGLDPYAGFLHADRPGKPSMTLDFIEEFRPVVVDRTVFALATKGVAFERQEDGLLSRDFRRLLVERIHQRLDSTAEFEGKEYPLRIILQMQARHAAAFLRGERQTYTPFLSSW